MQDYRTAWRTAWGQKKESLLSAGGQVPYE
jgi:hypothetical protein